MRYNYMIQVKDNDKLRESFNELTRQTFGFDFEGWYTAGHWGELYIPHVMLDGEKVISNISVNQIQFDLQGIKKNYIQLGTVMTDLNYRGQGLNREIMERILAEYADKADGIYLFGNDEVLDYYPKFGFVPVKEYEYYMKLENMETVNAYDVVKVDMTQAEQYEKLYHTIKNDSKDYANSNQNDAMYMSENLGLYQFWMAAGFQELVYYVPQSDVYVVCEIAEEVLHIHQMFGKNKLEIARFAKAFDEKIAEVVLGYTPVHKEEFLVREHKEEDSTLFILGEDLKRMEEDKMMFPVLSHA